jgi:hypothetical protein
MMLLVSREYYLALLDISSRKALTWLTSPDSK